MSVLVCVCVCGGGGDEIYRMRLLVLQAFRHHCRMCLLSSYSPRYLQLRWMHARCMNAHMNVWLVVHGCRGVALRMLGVEYTVEFGDGPLGLVINDLLITAVVPGGQADKHVVR